jgi:glucose-6-phosphate 1-dehydrogenase
MERCEAFWAANRYVAGAYDSRRDFELLNQELNSAQLQGERQLSMLNANRLFYLALPPSVFEVVTANIRHACMATKYIAQLFAFKLSFLYFIFCHTLLLALRLMGSGQRNYTILP